jgi:subtilisin family serine protease
VSLIQTYGYQKTVVAVIDTGLDLAHPIFAGRLMSDGFDYIGEKPGAWDGPDGKDSDLDGNVDEGVGHGSHVAGTVLRTNPNALILPLRVLDSDGMGYGYNVARAIHNAVDAGARIINLSLGMLEPSEPVNLALDYADAKGVTVFAAAGNTGAQKVLFPANRPSPYKPSLPEHARGVIAITAVDALDVKSSFAAWGKEVNLCAPGAKICGPTWGGGYAFWSGTSMATAVASGSASMILTLVPTYPETPAKPMVNGADKLDPKSALTPLLGAGRVNVLRAMGEVIYGWTPP